MMLFHHRHRAPSSSQNVVEPSSTTTQPAPKPSPPPRTVPVGRSRTQEDVYCLNFLPTLSFEPLPPTFKPPHGHHAAHQLLSYYGPKSNVLAALEDAARCIELSKLRDSMSVDLGIEESEAELSVALDEPTGGRDALSTGWLVRVQVVLKPGAQVPLLAEHGAGRWKPCGQDWRFESPVTGLGSIYINFIA